VIQLTTQPLSAARVIQAFPLIQTALPGVTLAAWRDFAAAQIHGGNTRAGDQEGGILAVTDRRGYIAGLCSYRLVPDLVHGRLLDTGHFLAFDLLERQPVAEALVAALEALARERGCTAVHTHLPRGDGDSAPPGPGRGLSGLLAARGYRVESWDLCKRLVA
jgi:GNAT superfamily N-acetyltransferase